MIRPLPFVLAGVMLAACSSEMHVSDLSPDATQINGIPFRTKQQFRISLYKLNSSKTKYEKVTWADAPLLEGKPDVEWSPVRSLADPDRLHVLRYLGMPLADMTADVKLNHDGTLSTVGFIDKSQADEALRARFEEG